MSSPTSLPLRLSEIPRLAGYRWLGHWFERLTAPESICLKTILTWVPFVRRFPVRKKKGTSRKRNEESPRGKGFSSRLRIDILPATVYDILTADLPDLYWPRMKKRFKSFLTAERGAQIISLFFLLGYVFGKAFGLSMANKEELQGISRRAPD